MRRWKNRFGSMDKADVRRLEELEQDNARLKKLVADLTLDKEILKEALSGKSGLSRPGEFHPRPLREPDVSLSAHPAPIT